MSLPRVILLLIAFTAYTPSPTVAQDPTLDEQRQARMDDWFDTKSHPALNLTRAERDYLRTSHDRSTIQLLSPVAGSPRSECRFMSRQKWNDYLRAWTQWHATAPNVTTGVTQHQLYCSQHRSILAPGAHFGPCFLSWHREYLTRWENALRKHVSTTSLCYINWLLDRWMVNPCDSVTFSPDYFGTSSGTVTTGIAAGWQLYPPNECRGRNGVGNTIWRQCVSGSNGKGLLYTDSQVNTFINSYSTYGQFSYPRNQAFEGAHGNLHGLVGGTMNSLPCSPNDPLFVSHHSNVDRIYQRFRDRLGAEKENQYPTWSELRTTEYANSTALPFNDMSPPMKCKDGLLMVYDNNVKYQDVPSTCTTQAACGNGDGKGALWCNTSSGRCGAKVKIGGNCAGTTAAQSKLACYTESRCATNATCTGSSTKTCTCTFKTG